jgi:hypothetical protein
MLGCTLGRGGAKTDNVGVKGQGRIVVGKIVNGIGVGVPHAAKAAKPDTKLFGCS